MSSKTVLIACLLFFGAALVYADEHNINDCLEPGDSPTLVYDQEITKSGAFLQTQEESIRIPTSGFTPKKISCVTVTNMESEATGGYPKILDGGVGKKYVIVHLTSQRSRGLDFKISVYTGDE